MIIVILILLSYWSLFGVAVFIFADLYWKGKITIGSIIACGPIAWIVAPLTYINRKKDRERRALGPKILPKSTYDKRTVLRNKNGTLGSITLVIDFSNK